MPRRLMPRRAHHPRGQLMHHFADREGLEAAIRLAFGNLPPREAARRLEAVRTDLSYVDSLAEAVRRAASSRPGAWQEEFFRHASWL